MKAPSCEVHFVFRFGGSRFLCVFDAFDLNHCEQIAGGNLSTRVYGFTYRTESNDNIIQENNFFSDLIVFTPIASDGVVAISILSKNLHSHGFQKVLIIFKTQPGLGIELKGGSSMLRLRERKTLSGV